METRPFTKRDFMGMPGNGLKAQLGLQQAELPKRRRVSRAFQKAGSQKKSIARRRKRNQMAAASRHANR